MKIRLFSILSLFMIATVAACASQAQTTKSPDTPITTVQGDPAEGQSRLMNELRAAGAEVQWGDSVEQPFLSVKGQILNVNGEDVQVFTYASSEALEADAAQVSADGSPVNSVISWIAPPHFFKSDRLLVLYVGDDTGILEMLESALGEQFAGG